MTDSPRPLIITDCDEVLLHMVVPFAQWVDAVHGVVFSMEDASFANALKRRECGTPLEAAEVWPLLDAFFRTEMHRQQPVAGAIEAMTRLAADADIIVLTNVGPDHQDARRDQLARAGLGPALVREVIGSRGSKGPRVAEIAAAHRTRHPGAAVLFIDDLAQHHRAVAADASDVWRLHLVGEPAIAARIAPERNAHARIDDWPAAERWLTGRLHRLPLPAAMSDGAPADTPPLPETIA